MKTRKMLLVLSLTLCTFGCAVEPPPEPVERSSQALLYWKPFLNKWAFELVGHGLNGISLNDQPLDEHMVVAVSLDGVVLSNGKSADLQLKRTRFYRPKKLKKKKKKKAAKMKLIKKKKIAGTTLTAYLEDGAEITLRIDGADAVKELPETYLMYAVSFLDGETWEPLCGVDAETGEPRRAVALNGTWEYEQGVDGGGAWIPNDRLFTFACEDFVLEKCVALGYTPWADGEICDTEAADDDCVEATLASRHQACTRALRADYCGDGNTHTVDGILLNLYDGIGIRADAEDWDLEAEWDADGARCVVADRVAALPAPPCVMDLDLPDCGAEDHFEDGALLFTEVDTPAAP